MTDLHPQVTSRDLRCLTVSLLLAWALVATGCRTGANGEGIESQPNPGETNNGTCPNMDRIDRVDSALETLLPRLNGPEDIDIAACPDTHSACQHLRAGLQKQNQANTLDPVKVAAFAQFVVAVAPELLFQVTRTNRASLIKCTDKPAKAVDGVVPWWTVPGRDTITWVQDIGLVAGVPGSTVAKARGHELGHHVEYPLGSGIYVSDLGLFAGFEGRVLLDLLASFLFYKLNEAGLLMPDPTPTPIVIHDNSQGNTEPAVVADSTTTEHGLGRAIHVGSCAGVNIRLVNKGPGVVRSFANAPLNAGWVYQNNALMGGGTCGTAGKQWAKDESCTVALAYCPPGPGPSRSSQTIALYSDNSGAIRRATSSLYAVGTQPIYGHQNASNYHILYTGSPTSPPGYVPLGYSGFSLWEETSVCSVPLYQCVNPDGPQTAQTTNGTCYGWTVIGLLGYLCGSSLGAGTTIPIYSHTIESYYATSPSTVVSGMSYVGQHGWAAP